MDPMRDAELQLCANCQRDFTEVEIVYSLPNDPFNDIGICRHCGLIYKPVYNWNGALSNETVYALNSWNAGLHTHEERLGTISRQVIKLFPESVRNGPILDIGAGIGLLYDELLELGPIGPYVAIEPVPAICLHLKKTCPNIFILNSDIQNVLIPNSTFSIIFACGVDYLFANIRNALINISKWLREDGVLVIQRNVFSDQTAYMAKPIYSLTDLFSDNNLIRNWFHSNQYVEFINQFFDVTHVDKGQISVANSRQEQIGFFYNYYCRSKRKGFGQNLSTDQIETRPTVNSYYSDNRRIIDSLSRFS